MRTPDATKRRKRGPSRRPGRPVPTSAQGRSARLLQLLSKSFRLVPGSRKTSAPMAAASSLSTTPTPASCRASPCPGGPTPRRRRSRCSSTAPLAEELGLDADALAGEAGAALFAGNAVPEGAEPIAQAYAGHQFGGFSPQLGDGRAVLLGEVIDRAGRRRDIAFKGSGRTPFSRGGDGKAAVGPMLREALIGEAMHALGIPTTRALAVVATGEPVLRETRAARARC